MYPNDNTFGGNLMNENSAIKKEDMEIDIQRILGALIKKIWVIAIAGILGAVIAFVYTFYFITPLYKSSAMFYVNNNDISLGNVSASITSSDLAASKGLVDSYIVILKTRASLNDVIEYAGVDRTYAEVKSMISAAAVDSTEIFEVVVTSPDKEEAEAIANAIAYILPKRISSIIDGTSAKVVEYAVVAASPSSPSYTKNVTIGFAGGVFASVAVIALYVMFDLTIRTDEDITQVCKHPILAEVPDMTAPTKGGYYYANGKKKKKYGAYGKTQNKGENVSLFGENISFAASEAYKLLRTKIQFSFADENDCHVLCTTSALAGEGKSLSSINLACSLAQLDKKVLLIDCDLRRPSIAKKVGIQRAPGLSDYLTRHVHSGDIVQSFANGNSTKFDIVAAGRIPPNPMELLGSARMEKIVNKFKDVYDYIILDLPPVEEVSDALVAAKLADGVLMVVRQDYCNRAAIENALKQLEFVNAKVLGVIFNATYEDGIGRKYYNGKYYGKKYYGYGYRHRTYENSYETSAEAAKKAFERQKQAEETGRVVRKRTKSEEE